MPRLFRIALVLLALSLAGFGAWLVALPPGQGGTRPPPIPAGEAAAMLEHLKPPKRARPVVAVIGINDATETTDYLVPTGILRRADVADVYLLATAPGPVKLYPVLTVEPDATLAQFDAREPTGPDYVIVPAMSRDDDPAILEWLRRQAANGATIIGVCAGAKVIAAAGLLDGKPATTHWYYLEEMLDRHPSIRPVADRRMVVNQGIATTTGITASLPMMLSLVEAIGGRGKAQALADDLGLSTWSARHDSSAFGMTRGFATTVLANRLAFWNRETVGIELRPGMDEAALALVADAWSRTYRSQAVSLGASSAPVETRNGVRIIPDQLASDWPGGKRIALPPSGKPVDSLDGALARISSRHGERTANVVAMQLEYPR